MKLYHNPLSTYSQKVLLALHETGIEVETIQINLSMNKPGLITEKFIPLEKFLC